MKFHPLAVFLPTLALLSCDRSEIVDSSASKTFALAPRIVSANGVTLPAVDSVRIVVLNANSPTASPYYDKSLDYKRHGDTIEGIPQNAQLEVRISGVKVQRDSSRAVWWSGKASATFSGTQTVDAQSLPVPVFTGDTTAPRVLSRTGDTIESTDTAAHLVWRIREDSAFTAVANGDTLRRLSDGTDSVVWQHPWVAGKSLPVSLLLRDKTGNLSRDSLTVIRRDRVALPMFGIKPGSYTDTIRVSLSDSTSGSSIQYSLDGGASWFAYDTALLLGSNTTIQARATKMGMTGSAVSSAAYLVQAAAPTFSVASGTSANDLMTVKLSSLTPAAAFLYSLDTGKTWKTYADSIVLGSSLKLQAKTIKAGLDTSTVNSASYVIGVAAPVFSVATGTSSNDLLAVKLTSATPAATFQYSLDGTTWLDYKDSLVLGRNAHVYAQALKTGVATSTVADAIYSVRAAAPTFSVASGTSSNDLMTVKLSSLTPAAAFLYSLDTGKTWKAYADSIVLGSSVKLQTKTIKAGLDTSAVSLADYTIGVAAPVFSVATGASSNDLLAVKLTSATPAATFQYSLDGTTWLDYKDSLVLGHNAHVYAQALKTGVATSTVADAIYSVRAAIPTFSVASGTISNDLMTVKLSSLTPAAAFLYSLDTGKTWKTYIDSIVLGSRVRLQAKTIKAGLDTSEVGLADYTIQAAAPVITGAISGTYHAYQTLRLATATPNTIIRYTLDGTDPIETSLLYADSILVDTSCTIKARAFKTGLTSSSVASAQYVLSLGGTISISIPTTSALWYTRKVLLTSDQSSASIHCTTNGSDATESSPLCNDSITVSDGATVKAIAYSTAYPKLSPTTAAFTYPSTWNTSITYGTLLDNRDGKSYRTVKIGTQTWMAENLNYRNTTGSSDTIGICRNGDADSCTKYGRLYNWLEVMNLSSEYASKLSNVSLPHQGICPNGWHVPSSGESDTLFDNSAANDALSQTLISTVGWESSKNGTDLYGFRLLPSSNDGKSSFLWLSTEPSRSATSSAADMIDIFTNARYSLSNDKTSTGFLRCLKD